MGKVGFFTTMAEKKSESKTKSKIRKEGREERKEEASAVPDFDDCSICCLPIDSKRNITITSCGHAFHGGCFANWVGKDPGKSCPLCRTSDPLEIKKTAPRESRESRRTSRPIFVSSALSEPTLCSFRFMFADGVTIGCRNIPKEDGPYCEIHCCETYCCPQLRHVISVDQTNHVVVFGRKCGVCPFEGCHEDTEAGDYCEIHKCQIRTCRAGKFEDQHLCKKHCIMECLIPDPDIEYRCSYILKRSNRRCSRGKFPGKKYCKQHLEIRREEKREAREAREARAD